MSMNILTVHNTRRSFTRSAVKVVGGATAAGLIGLGIGLAVAPSAAADDPVPVPIPGAASALPGAGNQVGNAFLQVLGSMLGRVVPGAEQILPATLPDPAATPATPDQPAAAESADPAGQTVT